MHQPFAVQEGRSKAQCVADALTRLMGERASRASKGAEVYDYYEIGVIGYGGQHARSALKGDLAGRNLVPISDIANHPLRVEQRTKKQHDGFGGLVDVTVRVPVWYEPVSRGKTPMYAAIDMAHGLIADFVRRHPTARPPVVINITDGIPTDKDPRRRAMELRELATRDGNVLLFNLHISSSNAQPIQFPVSKSQLPNDKYARFLFSLSSPIPPQMLSLTPDSVGPIAPGARGFVFNADMVATVQMLEMGTRKGR
jgi:hypothetical protein